MSQKLHPYCQLFPEMDADQFQELVTGMKMNGFRKGEEIITFNNEVLDGRNRLNAAEAAGVKPLFKPFKGTDAEALSFVVAKNLSRRHLTTSQRAVIAAEISKQVNLPTTIEAAAKSLKVSASSVKFANKLNDKSPKLAKKVKEGKITLHKARKQAGQLPPSQSKKTKPSPVEKADPKETAEVKSLGEVCRTAYFDKTGTNVDTWEELTNGERAAWIAAADAVVRAKG